ncbi:hypothetical protein HMPREF2139_04460 [Prevotella denticola DNF00960]|nr:hypothetical protein HMPREF2139_04460 [Prevotella denticola DNF00960]
MQRPIIMQEKIHGTISHSNIFISSIFAMQFIHLMRNIKDNKPIIGNRLILYSNMDGIRWLVVVIIPIK